MKFLLTVLKTIFMAIGIFISYELASVIWYSCGNNFFWPVFLLVNSIWGYVLWQDQKNRSAGRLELGLLIIFCVLGNGAMFGILAIGSADRMEFCLKRGCERRVNCFGEYRLSPNLFGSIWEWDTSVEDIPVRSGRIASFAIDCFGPCPDHEWCPNGGSMPGFSYMHGKIDGAIAGIDLSRLSGNIRNYARENLKDYDYDERMKIQADFMKRVLNLIFKSIREDKLEDIEEFKAAYNIKEQLEILDRLKIKPEAP